MNISTSFKVHRLTCVQVAPILMALKQMAISALSCWSVVAVKVMSLGLGCRTGCLLSPYPTPCAAVVNPRQSQSATVPQCIAQQSRATPAMPPAAWTASSHCCCSGRSLPVAVFTSMLVNTATVLPTISGVILTRFQPIRSALPLQRPKETGLPRWSLSVPVLLRNRRVSPLLQAILISCWIRCSLT
jgi:hypothetical protein